MYMCLLDSNSNIVDATGTIPYDGILYYSTCNIITSAILLAQRRGAFIISP